jgi:hypothetical protein
MRSYSALASHEMQASAATVEAALKRQGAAIVNIAIPHLSAAFKAHVVSILTEMRTAMSGSFIPLVRWLESQRHFLL